jgi:hypothetical protein
MLDAIANPFLTVAELPGVVVLLRVLGFLWKMTLESKQDKKLNESNRRLNDCQEKLRESEEQRQESEDQRDILFIALVLVIAIVAAAAINYRMVPRSLPAA